jgi:hypothetical protein
MTRDCHRLLAVIASKSSAESLDTSELLHLADWITAPIPEQRTHDWAEHIAVPIIAELGRRLARSIDTQSIDLPQVLKQVREMRSAQRRYFAARGSDKKSELMELSKALEAEVDELLNAEMQPSLFGDQ